jgi:hypothetical protein
MKMFPLLPLLFLTACSTTPRLVLRPEPPPPPANLSAIRYPEVVRAYHIGRYVDPNDDMVMHEQNVLFRVEENTRWNFHPGPSSGPAFSSPSQADAAFNPVPVNDAILAEVNSQRLATAQIMAEAGTLAAALTQFAGALQQTKTNLQQTAALRATVGDLQKRLAALESALPSIPAIATTNDPTDSLSPGTILPASRWQF